MIVDTIKRTWSAFNSDKGLRLASGVAFASMFSIAPLFIVLIAIAGGILGAQGPHGHTRAETLLLGAVGHSAGGATSGVLRQLISANFNHQHKGGIAEIAGWVAFVFTASNLFVSLQDALNTVWQVEFTKGGWKYMVISRAASFLMILAVGFLVLVTIAINAAVAFISSHYLASVPLASSPAILGLIGQVINLILITVVFGLLYKVLPDVTIPWKDVGLGAVVTAFLFVIGEVLIGIYLSRAGVSSAYGAAGSILIALLWIYYSAAIMLLGAEFTKIVSRDAKLTVKGVVHRTQELDAGADPRA